MNLFIYEVISWGGDGEPDTIFLVSATSVEEAGEMVDVHLRNIPPINFKAFAEAVCEIAPDPRVGNPTVILGPCFQFAYSYGWKKWKRERPDGEWELAEPQPPPAPDEQDLA